MRLSRENALRFLLFVALYVAGAELATWFVARPDQVSLIWPAAGVAYAVLLLYGLHWWPFIAVSVLLVHLFVSIVPWTFAGFSIVANTLAALVGAAYVQWRWVDAPRVLSMRTGFVLFEGALLFALLSALLGTWGLVAAGMIAVEEFPGAALKWALSDLFGVITVTPAMMVLAQRARWRYDPIIVSRPGSPNEPAIWITALIAATVVFVSLGGISSAYALGMSCVPLMVLLWGATRYEPVYTFVGTALLAMVTTTAIGLGIGGYRAPTSLADVCILIGFMSLMATIPLMVAAATHENRIAAAKLVRRGTTDMLTGLPNRAAFQDRVANLIAEHRDEPMALAYVDLDNFKVVNDTASHAVGDALIRALGSAMRTAVGGAELLARLGGDEFGILWRDTTPERAIERAQAVVELIANFRFAEGDRVIAPTASLGVVPFHGGQVEFAQLLARADAACFTAKELGGSRAQIAAPGEGLVEAQTTAMRWVSRLTQALDEDHFRLYAQTVAPLHAMAPHRRSLEVLVRLADPATGEILPPGQFVHAAERFKLGVKLDRHVLDRTLAWFDAHPSARDGVDSVGINLTAATVESDNFAEFVEQRVARSSLPPERLCFELTETSAVRDLSRAQDFIRRMRGLGCRFALDDFGSGFCSFAYLKSLDVDYFKIDGTFVRELESSALSLAIVRSIANIARVLDKRTVAEWVETPGLRLRVTELGVDYAQGYAIDRPVPIERWFQLRDGLPVAAAG